MKKYALITGASSGLGVEFAKQLAKKGYSLILTARRSDKLQRLADSLTVDCEVITADLLLEKDCYRLYEAVKDRHISIFINNAGFGDCGSFLETKLQKETDMIDLNVKAVHLLTKLMLKKMEHEKGGYILNVASSAGLLPAGPYMATYYATKAYVASLTRAVAWELRAKNSRVYLGCLCPGPVDTEFNSVANVEFALKGISAEYCVAYALKQMLRRQVVIVPTFRMKLATAVGRISPPKLSIAITARQQKKKMSSGK